MTTIQFLSVAVCKAPEHNASLMAYTSARISSVIFDILWSFYSRTFAAKNLFKVDWIDRNCELLTFR